MTRDLQNSPWVGLQEARAARPRRETKGRIGPASLLALGALAFPGTSSSSPTQVWETPGSYQLRVTSHGPPPPHWERPSSPRSTKGNAIYELRRLSGLTFEQLAKLFGVSRRTIHFWASGRTLSADNGERVLRTLDVVRGAWRGDAHTTREAILSPEDGCSPFDLLQQGKYDEARERLGSPLGHMVSSRPSVPKATLEARRPIPPGDLVDARHDRIHSDPGRSRGVRTVRSKQRGGQ
jgi:transcriptional regulator with XRE-family HTH domain